MVEPIRAGPMAPSPGAWAAPCRSRSQCLNASWYASQAIDEVDDLGRGMVEMVVDHGRVELRLGRQLLGGLGEPAADLLVGLGPAAAQPPLQLLEVRRLDEQQERVGAGGADLAGALHVDLGDHRAALLE